MTALHCPTCGCPVKVSGRTTKHYVPVQDPAVARLVDAARGTLKLLDGLSSIKAQPGSVYWELGAALAPFEEGK